jgi:hypothetical protein
LDEDDLEDAPAVTTSPDPPLLAPSLPVRVWMVMSVGLRPAAAMATKVAVESSGAARETPSETGSRQAGGRPCRRAGCYEPVGVVSPSVHACMPLRWWFAARIAAREQTTPGPLPARPCVWQRLRQCVLVSARLTRR